MEEIITERLVLRPFREADYDDLYEFLSQLMDRRIGYAVCEKYPPYCDEKDAVCMEKPLPRGMERRNETQPDGIGEMLITPVDSHKRT